MTRAMLTRCTQHEFRCHQDLSSTDLLLAATEPNATLANLRFVLVLSCY